MMLQIFHLNSRFRNSQNDIIKQKKYDTNCFTKIDFITKWGNDIPQNLKQFFKIFSFFTNFSFSICRELCYFGKTHTHMKSIILNVTLSGVDDKNLFVTILAVPFKYVGGVQKLDRFESRRHLPYQLRKQMIYYQNIYHFF